MLQAQKKKVFEGFEIINYCGSLCYESVALPRPSATTVLVRRAHGMLILCVLCAALLEGAELTLKNNSTHNSENHL